MAAIFVVAEFLELENINLYHRFEMIDVKPFYF